MRINNLIYELTDMVFYKKKKMEPINDFSSFCNILKEKPVELTNFTLRGKRISEKSILLKPKADTLIYRNAFIHSVKIEASDCFSEATYYINRASLIFFHFLVIFLLLFGFYGLFILKNIIFIIPFILVILLESVAVFVFYNTIRITQQHLTQLIIISNK